MARAVAALLAVLALLGAWRAVAYVTEKREAVAATPVPESLGAPAPIPLAPGAEACVNAIPFDEHSEAVRIQLLEWSGEPLAVRAYGPGYVARGRAHAPGADGLRGPGVVARLDPPRRPVIGELCIRNAGALEVVLAGSADGRARSDTRVAGLADPPDAVVTLLEDERRSLAGRAPDLLERAAAFNPLPAFGAWVLALLAAIAVPAAVAAALAVSLREPDPEPRSGAPAGPPARS